MDLLAGLEKDMFLEVPNYPNLVHDFFKNLRLNGESGVESMVKGVRISLSERKLG